MLITGTEGRIPNCADETEKFYRQGTTQSVESAWAQHRKRVDALKQEGKEIKSETQFQDYAEMLTRNERVILVNHLFHSA